MLPKEEVKMQSGELFFEMLDLKDGCSSCSEANSVSDCPSLSQGELVSGSQGQYWPLMVLNRDSPHPQTGSGASSRFSLGPSVSA